MTSEQELSNAVVSEVEIQDLGAMVAVVGRDGQTAKKFCPYMELHHLLFPFGLLVDKLSGMACVFDFETNRFVRLKPRPE